MRRQHMVRRVFHRMAAMSLGMAALVSLTERARAAEPIRGRIGVGAWNTRAEFRDIRVTKGGRTLYRSDFSSGLSGFEPAGGAWEATGGSLRQTGSAEPAMAYAGDPAWTDYTLTLKARKLGGDEGFLIGIGVTASDTKSWWNIGGWGNTRHALEVPGTSAEQVPGSIETGRWYDIRVELKRNTIRAWLDDRLVHTATRSPARRDFGRPLIPDLVADPSIAEFDGTFYLYGTTDGWGQGLATAGLPVAWKSKDFLNWSFEGSLFAPNFDAKYWAPSAPVLKDGRYYLFPTLDHRITALVADSPEGPFRALDGRDIHKGSGWKPFPITAGNPIDAEVFRDDDGAHYMVWSQRHIGKLKPDFSGFDGEPVAIPTKRGGYSEGPYLFKRNGIYYYLYTLGGSEGYQYAYMMSRTSPLGPWEAPEQDIISTTDHEQGIYGPGHGCFFSPKGSDQWYFVYLEYGRSGTNRQVWADRMEFNADGTIRPVKLTLKGVGALRTDGRYDKPNLALGRRATASSTLPDFRVPPINDSRLNRIEGFSPANALDGSNGSRWLAREDDVNAWFRLDLGRAREVRRTELYFVKPTAGHAYRLEHSLDGKTWQRFGGQEEPALHSPHVDEMPVRTRYLRLTVLEGTPGLWEFRVY